MGDVDWSTPCPYCGSPCDCDLVDVGIGNVQCGPYFCENCQASQIGPNDNNEATEEEQRIGWYGPGRPVSDQANTVAGLLVDHRTARTMYAVGLLDSKPEPKP
jgi:hypothetical protein